jgi:hypothetical protein
MLSLAEVRDVLEGMDIPCPANCARLGLAEHLALESIELVNLELLLGKRIAAPLPRGTLKLTDTIEEVLTKVNAHLESLDRR